jgi:hypothetical protein
MFVTFGKLLTDRFIYSFSCSGFRSVGPPGSRSVIIWKDPDPSIIKQKKVRKTMNSTILRLLWDFLSWKTDANVPSKSIKQKNLEKNLFFSGILKVTDEKSRIRIRKSVVRIQGSESGSVPECQGQYVIYQAISTSIINWYPTQSDEIFAFCNDVKKLLKYDHKQLILSHMYLPSEMCFECRRCSMKNLFLKTHSLIEKCTKIISYLMDNVS